VHIKHNSENKRQDHQYRETEEFYVE